jgi:hypothetical protein
MMLHPEHYKVPQLQRGVVATVSSHVSSQRFLEDDDEDEEHVGDDSGDGTAAEKDVTKEAVKK